MRTYICSVAAIAAASWSIDQARAADRIPAFDIVGNCSAEVANVGTEKITDCTKDEADDENALDKSWPRRVGQAGLRRGEQHGTRAELS